MTSLSPTLRARPDGFKAVIDVRGKQIAPAGLAFMAMLAIIAVAAAYQPQILSVSGMTIMLTSAVPLVLAAQAQMLLMSVGDIDLGIGALVGLVTVIAATLLNQSPVLGLAALAAIVGIYGLLALVIQLRNVPSIIATLGMSFVWLGIGLLLLPTPGGEVPAWLGAIGSWRPSWIPGPLVIIGAATLLVYILTHRTRAGVRMRALGSNAEALRKAGWSLSRTRVATYMFAAVLIIAAGLLLASQTRSGDINSSSNYTLVTIAAVILGGGSFAGGQAVPVGTAYGTVTLGLITVLLSLMSFSSNLQSAAQGAIVLAVLAGRIITDRFIK
jgi:ribose transport system permease protein